MTSNPKSSLKSHSTGKCSECGSRTLIQDHESAEIVCTNCGIVVKRGLVNRGPEWRAYTIEQQTERKRVGSPQTYRVHDKGLSTQIDSRDIQGYSSEKKAQLYRLRKWHKRSLTSISTERNLLAALSELNRIAGNLSLPKQILESASLTYRKALKKQLTRGRSIRGIIVAAIYLACRQFGVVRTLGELSQASGLNEKEIGSNYRFLATKLRCMVPQVQPSQYIERLCNELTLHGKPQEVAHKIVRVAKKLKLTPGKGPKGVAAAASYIAATITGERRTQRELAEAADITEVTIRNRYKEIASQLLIIISL